jgi:hypothetical protein
VAAERIVLHIGTHKTGSTSLQQFLRDHDRDLLARVGAHYPEGLVLPASHAELPLLAVRRERDWPARLRLPETRDVRWLAAARAHVDAQLREAPRPMLVLSHEDLSYVRFDDELELLRDLLGDLPVDVVVFLRGAEAFLSSYRAQLEATGFPPSADPTSFAYVEADSWLVDFDALIAGYRRTFGETNVKVIDYDAMLARDGSVIPSFVELLGIAPSSLPSLERYFLNQSGATLRVSDEQLDALRRRLAEQVG